MTAPADRAAERPESVHADGERLRGLLQHVATPIVVVSCETAGGPLGATIGSFGSVSLTPPTIAVHVTHGTRLHAALAEAETFVVQILSAGQADVAERFAIPDLDGRAQFAPFDAAEGDGTGPLLAGTLGALVCRRAAAFDVADHALVIGAVERIEAGATDQGPLLYMRQSYRGVGERV